MSEFEKVYDAVQILLDEQLPGNGVRLEAYREAIECMVTAMDGRVRQGYIIDAVQTAIDDYKDGLI